jgi:protein-tyrosine phosphatase
MANDEDFFRADLLVTMDDFNFSELSALTPDEESLGKIRPFCEYLTSHVREIPDPYYGGSSGFEKVLDLLMEGCVNLLDEIEKQLAENS